MNEAVISEPIHQGLTPIGLTVFQECLSQLIAGLKPLPDKPEETALGTLAALWHTAAGRPISVQGAIAKPLPELDEADIAKLRALMRDRMAGIPLAYLTARQQFMGIELIATEEALIPREETALLGVAALKKLREIVQLQGHARVIDVCTGSGNIALALAWHETHASVWASDLSEDAINLARRNLSLLGLNDRVEFRSGDLLTPFDEPEFHKNIDLLICNPPYISSAKVDGMSQEIIDFEPRLAFDGGPFGIRILSRLISEAPRFLRAGGWLAFEVGHGQGPGILKRIEQRGEYVDVFEVSDKQGEIRAILARLRLVGSAIQTFEKVADPTYVVVAANVAEESAEICSLWQTGLDANYSHQAKFDWYYRRHPDGIPEAFFLKYGNSKETVGVAAIGHRRMRQNGKSVLAGVLVDFVVLPEHRTLFPALTLQRDVRRRALISHQLAWGLPNSSATAVFSRAGYQCVGQLVRYVRVLRSAEYLTRYLPSWFSRTIGPVIDWTRFAGILLHSLGKRHYITHWQKQPDKRFDDLWERSSKPDELMGSRDERFLTWRFVNCPIGVYSFFTLVSKSDQRLVGYAVCEFANPSLRVRDFLTETESPGALSFLFRELAKDAFRKGYTTLVTEFLGSETIQTELAETGLIARERSPLYGAVTGESWKLPQEKHWYLTCADMDG